MWALTSDLTEQSVDSGTRHRPHLGCDGGHQHQPAPAPQHDGRHPQVPPLSGAAEEAHGCSLPECFSSSSAPTKPQQSQPGPAGPQPDSAQPGDFSTLSKPGKDSETTEKSHQETDERVHDLGEGRETEDPELQPGAPQLGHL